MGREWEKEGGREERASGSKKTSRDVCRAQLASRKSCSEREAALGPGRVPDRELSPAVCGWAVLEWQIRGPSKRGFRDSPGLLSEKSHFVWLLSASACSPDSGMCPPRWSLSCYQGDKDGLGSDLGLNGWSGLNDQGLSVLEAALASQWHEAQRPTDLLAFSIYFHCRGTSFRSHGAFDRGIWWHISDPGSPSSYRLNVCVFFKFIC